MSEFDFIETLALNVDSYLENKSTGKFDFIPSILIENKSWQLALEKGKVKLARQCVGVISEYLMINKRIPEIKKLIQLLEEKKIVDTNYLRLYLEFIRGELRDKELKNNEIMKITGIKLDLAYFANDRHPEVFKKNNKLLIEFLLKQKVWEVNHWKLAYESILRYGENQELLIEISEKILELQFSKISQANLNQYYLEFCNFIIKKKPDLEKILKNKLKKLNKFKKNETLPSHTHSIEDCDLFIFTDQVNSNTDLAAEERKVLISIKALPKAEIERDGKELAIAFSMMGMEKVVHYLVEQMITSYDQVKDIKKIVYLKIIYCHSLYTRKNYYQVIDQCQDIELKFPLLENEITELRYLMAESYFYLEKYSMAKKIYIELKKINKNYKLVAHRLNTIENIK